MSHSCTRRNFLGASAGLLAGIGAASLLPKTSFAANAATLVASCRDAVLPPNDKGCWAALQEISAEGVELGIGEDLGFPFLKHPTQKYSAATPADIDRLKADAAAASQKITAFLMANRFADQPDFQVEWCTKAAQAAQKLGVKAIRIDVVSSNMPVDQFVGLAGGTIKKILDNTESTGVSFGVENHGPANNPEFLLPLFEKVNSPRFGLTFDTGNFYWYGFPLSKIYELCEKFAPHVVHTHCKNINSPEAMREVQRERGYKYGELCCPIYEGNIDFQRIVSILKKGGYSNDLCIEDEALGRYPEAERAGILKREIEFLKKVRS
jgi:sugar phosphate isomerase/epimerase